MIVLSHIEGFQSFDHPETPVTHFLQEPKRNHIERL
jgi:hypothetical protein